MRGGEGGARNSPGSLGGASLEKFGNDCFKMTVNFVALFHLCKGYIPSYCIRVHLCHTISNLVECGICSKPLLSREDQSAEYP